MHERAERLKAYFVGQHLRFSGKYSPYSIQGSELEYTPAHISNYVNHLVDQADGIEDVAFHPHHPKELLEETIRLGVNKSCKTRGLIIGGPFAMHIEYLADALHIAQILGNPDEQLDTYALAAQVRIFIAHLEHQSSCSTNSDCNKPAYHEDENTLREGVFTGIIGLERIKREMLTAERIAS